MSKYLEKTQHSSENVTMERTYDAFTTESCYSPLPTRFDRLAYAPMDESTKKKVQKYEIIDGGSLAGECMEPGDVYFNK